MNDFVFECLPFTLKTFKHTAAAIHKNLSFKQPLGNIECAVHAAGLLGAGLAGTDPGCPWREGRDLAGRFSVSYG
jgi:hypothetical protein